MPSFHQPFVTAIMLTGRFPECESLARLAIDCFEKQTYPKGELLILNTGDLIEMRKGEIKIRQILLSHPGTLGDLRNIAIKEAKGELCINWDDDDWSHPTRIEQQVEAFKEGHMVLLRSQTRLNLLTGELAQVNWNHGISGTMMWAKDDRRVPPIDQGEDVLFVESFPGKRVVLRNSPCLHVRTFHGGNVSSEQHIMRPNGASPLDEEECAIFQSEILPQYKGYGILT